MTGGGVARLARRAQRAWHTFRHVPPAQLVRRAELTARFRLGRYLPAGTDGPVPDLVDALPVPPFPPRPNLMRLDGDALVLQLPWGDRRLGTPPAWSSRGTPGTISARADLNNLHFMEYLESVDDRTAAALIEDWIEHNPAEAPDAWRYAWRPYNLAVRAAVWLEGLARRRDCLPPATVRRTSASLAQQLRYLERHLETDLRGNHLIKNIRALAWGGACFAGPDAERWTELAHALLRRELAEQILPDGCHYERSPAYHCQVMADLLACRAALRPALPELDRALDRMAGVLALLTHPDGRIAPFNDGGLSMAPAPAELAAVHAALGGAPATPPYGAFALPEAGYFGLRGPGELLLVDCGALGPSYLPGHGHCDLLSFEWSSGGRRIVVDQGTHQYLAGPRRLVSRRTASHNTVTVGAAEQSDIYGAFRCGRRATPELRAFEPSGGGGFRFVGSHDGYAKLPGAPRHVRSIQARPGEIRVDDEIEGRVHAAAAHLLLHPDCRVEVAGTEAVIRNGPVTVRLAASAPISTAPAEWYPDIHVAVPTVRLALPLAGDGRLSLRLVASGGAPAP
jgi:uncharacterized heparinase superfamily protein